MSSDVATFPVQLPSGRTAVVRGYNALAANAIGDEGLREIGQSWFKAISALTDSIDGVQFPDWRRDRPAAIAAAEALLVNDMMLIIFMSTAHYHDGVFEGDIVLADQSKVAASIRLLDADGNPMPEFKPAPYPLGNETRHEWTEEIKDVGSVKFSFGLMTGARLSRLQTDGADNLTQQLAARDPLFWDPEKSRMTPLDVNRMDVPQWALKAIGREVRRVDPVIQFSTAVRARGKNQRVIMIGQPDFFLRDFQ